MVKQEVMSDFAGFDSPMEDMLFSAFVKGSQDYVFIYAHTWFDARALAQTYFLDAYGFPFSYDAIGGVHLDERTAVVTKGRIFVTKDKAGNTVALEAARNLSGEQARRGEGLRKRESVAFEVGRKVEGLSSRVQEDRQSVSQPEVGDVETVSIGRVEGGERASSSHRVSNGAVGVTSVGSSSRASIEGGK